MGSPATLREIFCPEFDVLFVHCDSYSFARYWIIFADHVNRSRPDPSEHQVTRRFVGGILFDDFAVSRTLRTASTGIFRSIIRFKT
jgi:hypothetical protein